MVDLIEYDGKKYPIKVSFVALNGFEKEMGIPLSLMGEEMKNHECLCWHALVAGHKKAKEELTLVREDVEWVLDESLAQYQKIFMDSMVKMGEALGGDVTKKK